MSYQADDFEAIRRRQEEIEAARNLALTGSTIVGVVWPDYQQKYLPSEQVGEAATGCALTAYDDLPTA